MRHQLNPIERDLNGDWDNVVLFVDTEQRFMRYVDRNGEEKEEL